MADQFTTTSAPAVEEWRDIPSYEGFYQVSDCGRVRSLGAHTGRGQRPRTLSSSLDSWGYPQLGLCRDGLRRTRKVHSLVAETFMGCRPTGYQINHKNGVKSDARLGNLEYVTPSENIQHSVHVLGHKRGGPRKAVIGRSDGRVVRFESTRAATDAGFCGSHIVKCCKGKLNHHGGYVWSYDNS